MSKIKVKNALLLGFFLAINFANTTFADNYVTTHSSYDHHKYCLEHNGYVGGTDVIVRSGPSTSYDIVGVTQDREHLIVSEMVGENFSYLPGRIIKNTTTFKTKFPIRLNAGDYVSVKRINTDPHSAWIVAEINGDKHAISVGEIDIDYNIPIWFSVGTENGLRGYIYGKYIKKLGEGGNAGNIEYRYYYCDWLTYWKNEMERIRQYNMNRR